MKRKFQAFNFSIVPNNAAAKKTIDIYIDGQIVDAETQSIYEEWFGDDTSVSYKSFRSKLMAEDADVYNIYINSPGGLVTDAMAMHDLLESFTAKGKTVNTEGRGLIASAATFILMASPEPKMSANSWLMIHNVSGFAYGSVDEVEQQAAVLRQFNNRVSKFYQEKTGLAASDVDEMMKAETWLSPEDAKAKGFIKAISNEAKIKNSIQKENWFFQNVAVLNAYNEQVKAPAPTPDHNNNFIHQQINEMKKVWQDLQATITNLIGSTKPVKNEAATDNTTPTDSAEIVPAVDTTAVITNAFAAIEADFEKESGILVTNQCNAFINDIAKNEAFNAAVATAVAAEVKKLNLATTDKVEKVAETVEKIEVQNMGNGSTDTTDKKTTQRRALGSWRP